MNRHSWIPVLLLLAAASAAALADGPADNIVDRVRPIPPPGIEVPPGDRVELERGLAELGAQIERLRAIPAAADRLPDVEIYHCAVRYALEHREFFAPADIARARRLLTLGNERASQLASGQAPWLQRPGPTALGYRSTIDGSVQPYGLSIPAGAAGGDAVPRRLDTWFHGRGETLSEVNFLDSVHRSGGPFARGDVFVLQPYGRYCCANKLAGEVDLFEALANVRSRFAIDPDRVVVRGFSMGGAACWQFAAHYATDWAAAAPGAGFSETPEFLRIFQRETTRPTWWERKLWQMYDCPVYAPNFSNLPVVAYSGENDSQKQAADVMEKALRAVGIELVHVIGAKTGHSYHPEAKKEIDRRIDAIAARGRDPLPRRIAFRTPTLYYHRHAWLRVTGLQEHWSPGQVDGTLDPERGITLKTEGITELALEIEPGLAPFPAGRPVTVTVNGARLSFPGPRSDRSWSAALHLTGAIWTAGRRPGAGLRKAPGLQGPIDDAFLRPFLIVRPSGQPQNSQTGAWVKQEMERAIREWRRQFRGEPRVKNDTEVTQEDAARYNLALWGDPSSNHVLRRLLPRLPLRWNADELTCDRLTQPSGTHVPLLVYPNPEAPANYIVLNSGFTYREYDYLNNARQTPRLPDWAVVDTRMPPNSRWPGAVTAAGFFDEQWRWKPAPSTALDSARAPARSPRK